MQLLKYVLTCKLGIIEFLSSESRYNFIEENNVTDYTLSSYIDEVTEDIDITE